MALRKLSIETVNLYSAFVAVSIKLLAETGELVAIVPRSFCNGPYYQPFREILLTETSIKHIHIFESRDTAFDEDEVLQENIIIHCVKGVTTDNVTLTSSPTADFHFDDTLGQILASNMTRRVVNMDQLVYPNDPHKFIHIAVSEIDQQVVDALSEFTASLEDLNIQVSTGPVVDFRMKEYLTDTVEDESVPLIYSSDLNGTVTWEQKPGRKNLIRIADKTRSSLWQNEGHFLVLKRFSSKEEKRRIIAAIYEPKVDFPLIGFDNMLNVFHAQKKGLNLTIVKGLYIYLNSTLVDVYYRQFGGHTQVNATDLRSLNYPSQVSLIRLGEAFVSPNLSQLEIDSILEKEIKNVKGNDFVNPLLIIKRIKESYNVLFTLGIEKSKITDRLAITFLSLLKLSPENGWNTISSESLTITEIMEWSKNNYKKDYFSNSTEVLRNQVLQKLQQIKIVKYVNEKYTVSKEVIKKINTSKSIEL